MNSITELLDLEDSDVFISDITIQGTTKFLTIETRLCAHYCPSCGFKMHSRGIKKRTIKHPILQDNYELVLILKQRRWKCTNPDCGYDISDTFKFVNKRRRQPMPLICSSFMPTVTLWKHLHLLLLVFTYLILMYTKSLSDM